jgi:DNA-binding LytR/AlgR family response regulator
METSETMVMDNLKEDISAYFNFSLADFYSIPGHRLMVYAIIFILAGMSVFAGLAVYDYNNDLITIPLKFMGINAWHTAANFSFWTIAVDLFCAYISRPWGAYHLRTTGKVWIILFSGYLVGFLTERAFAYKLIGLYEPGLIYLWEVAPSQRAGTFAMFIFTLPFWLAIAAVVIAIITRKQAQTQEFLRVRIDTILEERMRLVTLCPESAARTAAENTAAGGDFLPLPADSGIGPIRISDISHVTAEDHYLRIYYQCEKKLQNTLIRMSLKALSARLPQDRFVRIHRSHLVNLENVSALKRYGQAARLSTKLGDFKLPVSRYRMPQILPVLEKFLIP